MAVKSASKFHEVPDSLWLRIELLLPIYKTSCKGGRPRLPLRQVVNGILYVLYTGCQWKAMPKQFGSGSAIHAYFQEWVERACFTNCGNWLSSSTTASRESTGSRRVWAGDDQGAAGWGKNREKPDGSWQVGSQRSVLVDGQGVPLAAAVDGANVHDQKLLAETLDAIPVERPQPKPRQKQHLCLDKGYTGEPIEREALHREYVLHVPPKGGETVKPKHRRGKARRWKVERTHSWINRARRLLIRWEKKVANYLGFLHLQFAIVALRTAGVLG